MRPFRDGAPFLLLIETPQTFWVPVTFFPYCVSLFVTTVSYDNDRLLASILCIKLLHVTFVFCPHLLQHIPFLLVNFTFSHYVSSTPFCFATRAHLCIFFLPISGVSDYATISLAQIYQDANVSYVFRGMSYPPKLRLNVGNKKGVASDEPSPGGCRSTAAASLTDGSSLAARLSRLRLAGLACSWCVARVFFENGQPARGPAVCGMRE